MNDVLLVYVLHALQDLPHVTGTGELRVLKVIVHEAFEKLSTCDTEETDKTSAPESSTR